MTQDRPETPAEVPQEVSLDLLSVRNDPAYRSIARLLKTKILAREWARGEKLPSEAALAEHLRINRSTLREAIRSLEEQGLVERRAGGKSLFVSVPQQSELASRITDAIILHEVSFYELWECMVCLEPALAEGAAERITPDELAALEENIARTRDALADEERLAALDVEFHDIIAQASRNRALQLCRKPVSQLFYPAFLEVFSRLSAGSRLLVAHENILNGLRQHDRVLSRSWMNKHIADFRRGYERAKLDMASPAIWPRPAKRWS